MCNDLVYKPKEKILIITGSNMSGKSTFLRTAGINLVLAYAGGPVCAERFICPVMELYSCMRVKDNLEKNISSFLCRAFKDQNACKSCRGRQNDILHA